MMGVNKIKYLQYILSGVSLLILNACSHVADKPDWVDTESSHYNSERYLSASAQGDSRQVADNRALGNLAKIFQVSITDKSVDFSEAKIIQGELENKLTASRVVNTSASQVVRGARIAEHWQDPVTGKFTSLAVIEKQPAAAALTTEIEAADNFTRDAIYYATELAPNPLLALNSLETARQRQLSRTNDNHNLRVLTGSGISTKYSVESLTEKIRTSLSKLNLAISSNESSYLEVLQGSIATVGANIIDKSVYQVSLVIEKQAVTQGQSWYWLRGGIVLEVFDKGVVISQLRQAFKVSAQDKTLLTQRLKNKLTAELPAHIYTLLTPKKSQP